MRNAGRHLAFCGRLSFRIDHAFFAQGLLLVRATYAAVQHIRIALHSAGNSVPPRRSHHENPLAACPAVGDIAICALHTPCRGEWMC